MESVGVLAWTRPASMKAAAAVKRAGDAERARGRRGAASVSTWRWHGVRRWRGRTAAVRTSSSGGMERRARARSERRRREVGKPNEEERPAAWARDINDIRAPRFFLMPVDPMLGFRMPVKCIGSVHPRLLQKLI